VSEAFWTGALVGSAASAVGLVVLVVAVCMVGCALDRATEGDDHR
jgi:hypothetical protein